MEKEYNDYLEEFKSNIESWVKWYGFSYNKAFEDIKDYLMLVPIDYRDELKEELKLWSFKNDR